MARSSGQAARLARSKAQSQPRNAIAPLTLTLLSIVTFCLFTLLPRVRTNPIMLWSFLGPAFMLLAALAVLKRYVARRGRRLSYELAPRPVHYVQLCMHSAIYIYWGWYWRPVYHFAALILAQIAFAYAVDMIVCWFRHDNWILGFGPFPIVLSTNLFLWFKDDWFYLQFALIAVGVLGKEFIKWKRDGKLAHIFNPSAFSLSVFSLVLILLNNRTISVGTEIANTQQRPPYIYLEIFILGLIVQSLFRVTLVTLSSAAALYALNLVFTHHTGSYLFADTNIPAAVFLGMHLLVTDPATSPRPAVGKVLFGLGYGVLVFGLYWWFDQMSIPTFYDKLLPVPLLNLCVPLLENLSGRITRRLPRLSAPAWRPSRLNYAHMAVWTCLFVVFASTHFVGATHPGQKLEFWQQGCSEGRYNACHTLAAIQDANCTRGIGGACLEEATLLMEGRGLKRDSIHGEELLGQACYLGQKAACNQLTSTVQRDFKSIEDACDASNRDACVLLAVLLRKGIGVQRDPARALRYFEKACERGSGRGCESAGESYAFGDGTPADNSLALTRFQTACDSYYGLGCFNAGMMYWRGLGVERSRARAVQRFRRGCEIGYEQACSPAAIAQSMDAIPE